MKRITACLLLVSTAATVAPLSTACGDGSIDVATWVAHWPDRYVVEGGKSEPTYVEAVTIERRGDVFSSLGGAPAWEARARETISVDAQGTMRHLVCPQGMRCTDALPTVSFLSSAALLAAYRAHRPLGRAVRVPYGARSVLCLPAERLGVRQAVLDPCFDFGTGAVLAQRHRLSGRFDGPSLDPGSIRITSVSADRGRS